MDDLRSERVKKEIGKRLRELREAAGITVASIEKRSKADGKKIDRTYIYDIENGNANWSIEHLARILSYCHSSLESFFFGLQKSDIPVEQQPFHRMLATILNSKDPDLTFGIRVNLEAISEKAIRVSQPGRTEEEREIRTKPPPAARKRRGA